MLISRGEGGEETTYIEATFPRNSNDDQVAGWDASYIRDGSFRDADLIAAWQRQEVRRVENLLALTSNISPKA